MSDSTSLAVPGDDALQIGNWVVEDFWDSQDFGNKPDYSAEDMQGRCIIVRGLSVGEFESPKFNRDGVANKARSILHNWPEEHPNMAPWGIFLSSTSVPIKKLSGVVKFPVAIRMWRRQGANAVYWDMERYTPRYNSDGKVIPPNDEKLVEAFLKEKEAVLD